MTDGAPSQAAALEAEVDDLRARLLEAETRLALAQEAGGLHLWSFDYDANRLEWRDDRQTITAPGGEQRLTAAEHFLNNVHPDDRERVAAAIAAIPQTGGIAIEFRGARKFEDGHRTFVSRGRLLGDHLARTGKMVGVHVEVSAQRSVERTLQESEARFRGVFESDIAGLAILHGAAAGDLTVNDALLKLTGYTRAEFDADPAGWRELVWPALAHADLVAAAQLKQQGWFAPFEKTMMRRDGMRMPVRLSSARLPGAAAATVVWVEDLTAQKRAQLHRTILIEHADLLHGPADPSTLFSRVCVMLGEQLDLSRCMLMHIDLAGGVLRIEDGYVAPGLRPNMTVAPLGRYDPVLAELDAGQTVVCNDVHTDPRIGPDYAERLARGEAVAFVTVPLRRKGETVACLTLTQHEPRKWFPDKVEVIKALAERTWLAIENARLAEERDRTLAELAQSENRFRVLAESTPQLVWSTRGDGYCDYFSPQWTAYTGAPAEAHYGDGWMDVVHPDDLAEAGQAWSSAVAGIAPYDVEYRLRGADGEYRWFKGRGRPVRNEDGAISRWYGVSVDITQIVEAREALAEQVRLRTAERNRVFDLSEELIAVGGFDGWLKVINPAWSRILGVSDEELLGAPLAGRIHPDDIPGTRAVIQRMMAGESVRHENRMQTARGEHRWFSWTGVPEGQLFYSVGRDITAERQAADELRQANARLESEIAERARIQEQLVQAQKMEAVGQLTGGVAHDFNNLLQVIVGGLNLLESAEGARRGRLLDAMSQAARRGETLTRQLLAFSRKSALKPQPLDLQERVESMRELLDRSLRGDIRVETRFDRKLAPIEVDPGELELAILNVAVNARDAMPDGGVITISAEEVERLDDGLSGRFVRLALTDTGEGMSPEVQARVFEPFFTTKEVGKGSGLGLSQVYGFASQSGGGVRITSEIGRGTTVALYLPCSAAAVSEPVADAPQALAGAPLEARVLLVEDDEAVAQLAQEMLLHLGHTPVRAASAAEGLALLRGDAAIDVVLSDVMMPGGMSGIDLALGARELRPDLPIVLATGYPASVAGLDLPVLAKPYRIEALGAALQAALAGPA